MSSVVEFGFDGLNCLFLSRTTNSQVAVGWVTDFCTGLTGLTGGCGVLIFRAISLTICLPRIPRCLGGVDKISVGEIFDCSDFLRVTILFEVSGFGTSGTICTVITHPVVVGLTVSNSIVLSRCVSTMCTPLLLSFHPLARALVMENKFCGRPSMYLQSCRVT